MFYIHKLYHFSPFLVLKHKKFDSTSRALYLPQYEKYKTIPSIL